MKWNKKIITIIYLSLVVCTLQAQNYFEEFTANIPVEWKEIKQDTTLNAFFSKLQRLERKNINQVNIVHIGDSHIQADWFSGETRVTLQRKFGNAGRGLVFPYQVAKSNSPSDVYSKSNYTWDSYRNIHTQSDYEIGISGFVIATKDTAAYLKLALNDKNDMGGYGFNKITIFHPKEANLSKLQFFTAKDRDVIENNVREEERVYYTVKPGDNLGAIAVKTNSSVAYIRRANHLKSTLIYPKQKLIVATKAASKKYLSQQLFIPIDVDSVHQNEYATSYYFTEKREFIFIKNSSEYTQWDGFMLENIDSSGILYHTIGVNGAKYEDYNTTPTFFKQLSQLDADLVIVSLGTNESLDYNLSEQKFEEQMNEFYSNLSKALPNIPVLITNPTDNSKASAQVNEIVQKIDSFAVKNNFAFFDYYNALGGKGAFHTLRQNRLAQRDGVHLTAKGYKLQGFLLSKALEASFIKYKENGVN